MLIDIFVDYQHVFRQIWWKIKLWRNFHRWPCYSGRLFFSNTDALLPVVYYSDLIVAPVPAKDLWCISTFRSVSVLENTPFLPRCVPEWNWTNKHVKIKSCHYFIWNSRFKRPISVPTSCIAIKSVEITTKLSIPRPVLLCLCYWHSGVSELICWTESISCLGNKAID